MFKTKKIISVCFCVLSLGIVLNCGSAPPEKSQINQTVGNSDEPVKLTVSKRGYEPKSFETRKGQPVKLAILREDEENCGEEIVFPDLNIKKNLPVGETVLVEFTPQEPGELGFTCGMDMLRGKIIVSE